jgi:hypothetical protein
MRPSPERNILRFQFRHGVRHLTAQVRGRGPDGVWNWDELKRMRGDCESLGDDPGSLQAFGYGYLRALIDTVNVEQRSAIPACRDVRTPP